MKYVSKCLEQFQLCKMQHLSDQTFWDNILHGSWFWWLQGVISRCRWLYVCHVYGISWRSQRSRGDEVLCTNGTFLSVLNTNVASSVFARCWWDALWELTTHLDLRLHMCLELLKLWCPMLNGLEGNQTSRNTPESRQKCKTHPWQEPRGRA